ncbi:MAG: hypothetical protein AAF289_00425 [Cyanobacteria bacterium P01_A01_bin.135]
MAISEYPNLGAAIRGTCEAWCHVQGYSDPFCRNGEWWAFPPGGVMPVQIKTVMDPRCHHPVKIGPLSLALSPDGSVL